jgi:hypothetical protein
MDMKSSSDNVVFIDQLLLSLAVGLAFTVYATIVEKKLGRRRTGAS